MIYNKKNFYSFLGLALGLVLFSNTVSAVQYTTPASDDDLALYSTNTNTTEKIEVGQNSTCAGSILMEIPEQPDGIKLSKLNLFLTRTGTIYDWNTDQLMLMIVLKDPYTTGLTCGIEGNANVVSWNAWQTNGWVAASQVSVADITNTSQYTSFDFSTPVDLYTPSHNSGHGQGYYIVLKDSTLRYPATQHIYLQQNNTGFAVSTPNTTFKTYPTSQASALTYWGVNWYSPVYQWYVKHTNAIIVPPTQITVSKPLECSFDILNPFPFFWCIIVPSSSDLENSQNTLNTAINSKFGDIITVKDSLVSKLTTFTPNNTSPSWTFTIFGASSNINVAILDDDIGYFKSLIAGLVILWY